MSEFVHHDESRDDQQEWDGSSAVPLGMQRVVAAIITNGPEDEAIWKLRRTDDPAESD